MRAGRLALHREHAKPAQFLVEHRKCLGEALVHSQLRLDRRRVDSALRRRNPIPLAALLVRLRLCYHGHTMVQAKGRTPRAGRTHKVSISLNRADLATLRQRARRLYGGNLSAAIAEAAHRFREEEGREALVAWLGDTARLTPDQREAIRAEWRDGSPRARRRRVA
jgi:hypothetical protein